MLHAAGVYCCPQCASILPDDGDDDDGDGDDDAKLLVVFGGADRHGQEECHGC